jgi:hypothetical protein
MTERLSGEFRRLAAVCAAGRPTFRTLLRLTGPRDHALVTLLLGACFMHPIPMPGLSWILGVIITIAGTRMALDLGPWIPARFLDRPLPARALETVFAAAARAAARIERLVHPRGRSHVSHPWARAATGAAAAACGLLILVPLPPPTNFPPATALILLSLGYLEEDAAVWWLGWFFFALNIAFFAAIAVLGWSGVKALLG